MVVVSDDILEQLKPWVESALSQVVDADIDILTTYVLALLKHDLPINELSKMCVAQLEDFLHENARPFVDGLMNALESVMGYHQGEPGPKQQQLPQSQQSHSIPEPEPSTQFHGQEQFRQNFRSRRDRDFGSDPDYNDLYADSRNDRSRYDASAKIPQIPQYPHAVIPPPPPQMLGLIPPFDINGPPPPQFPPEYMAFLQAQQQSHQQNQSRGRRNRRNNRDQNRDQYRDQNRDHQQHRNMRPYSDDGRSAAFTSPLAGKKIENDYSSTKLVVEKVPDDKFNKESVTEYFSKFGNLLKINLNNQYRVVELDYESHDQARAAYESPEAIFNNRFVRVYWRKVPTNNENGDGPTIDFEAVARIQGAKQKEFEEKRAKRLEYEAKMKQVLEMKSSILKEQQKLLLQQASTANSDGNNSTEALKLQLEALKAEAESLGINSSSESQLPLTRGRGGYRGRARGFRGSYHPYSYRGGRGGSFNRERFSLDLRPKSVLVTPIPTDKEEALRSHLLHFGEYEEVRRSPTSPGFVVDFKDRKSAELFYHTTKEVPEIGSIEMRWDRSNQNENQSMSPEPMDMN